MGSIVCGGSRGEVGYLQIKVEYNRRDDFDLMQNEINVLIQNVDDEEERE